PSPLGEGHFRTVEMLNRLHQSRGLKVIIITSGFVYGAGGLFKQSFPTLSMDQDAPVDGRG
ncbi:MAG TPA: hypothetical protein VF646_00110, partial [Cytophagales bacterium]